MVANCDSAVPKAGAPLLCVVRYADISVKPDSPAVRPVAGGVEVDLGKVLNQNPAGAYGIIFSETTEFICANGSQVNVPGAGFGVEALVRQRVKEHFEKWCECEPPVNEPLCSRFGGLGGVGNQYRVTIGFTGTESRTVDDECQDFPLEFEYKPVVWGPIGKMRVEIGELTPTVCGKAYSYTCFLESCAPGNPCKAFEEVAAFVAGTVSGGSYTVKSIEKIFGDFPEQCPPPSCIPRPQPPVQGLPQDAIEEPDVPPLPEGESAVTTVIVEGTPGKDGKNVQIQQLFRNPSGQGNYALLVDENANERTYDLYLEEEMESELVSIETGVCDIVENEFTRGVIDVVIPKIAQSPGWGPALAAIAKLALIAAEVACESKGPVTVKEGLNYWSGVAPVNDRFTADFTVLEPTASWPDDWVRLTYSVGLGGVGRLPSTVNIDTFDGNRSEGCFGMLYSVSLYGYEPRPFPLRHMINSITFDDKRNRGVRLILPGGMNYGVYCEVEKLKP